MESASKSIPRPEPGRLPVGERPYINKMQDRSQLKQSVASPETPPALALQQIHSLFWRDLADLARDLRVHSRIRRKAESLLQVRLEEMSRGERVAYARVATRGMLPALAATRDPLEMKSLLQNPRLSELHAVALTTSPAADAALLRWVAFHGSWGHRPQIRRALLLNRHTPTDCALRLMRRTPRAELHSLLREGALPQLIAVAVRRRLEIGAGAESV